MFSSIIVIAALASQVAGAINGYNYVSCQSSNDFAAPSLGFAVVSSSATMTVEVCTAQCAGLAKTYTAIFGASCYCGNNFGAFAPASQDALCSTTCPGNKNETCGGTAAAATFYSLYSLAGAAPVVASSFSSSTSVASASSTKPASTTTVTVMPVMITSTIYSTQLITITSCAAVVTNCPAMISTALISIGTTIFPAGVTTTTMAAMTSAVAIVVAPSNGTLASTLKASTTSASAPTTAIIVSTSAAKFNGTIVTATGVANGTLATSATRTATSNTATSTLYRGAASAVGVENFGLLMAVVGLLAFV